jgi:hypothetical protein
MLQEENEFREQEVVQKEELKQISEELAHAEEHADAILSS